MARAKLPKNLAVDGTAKLAAKSKPSDKHEAPDLNIEEATVASPRPSRKRAGDFFDFEDGTNAESSSNIAELETTNPEKMIKTAPADADGRSHEVEAKPAATKKTGKKTQSVKEDSAETPSQTTTKTIGKGKRPRKPNVAKSDAAGYEPESSKKSTNPSKELAAKKKPNKADATPGTAKVDAKSRTKTSKAEKDTAEQESSTVAPDIAMDEGPLETLLEAEQGHPPKIAEKLSADGHQAKMAGKESMNLAKDSNPSELQSAIASVAETATSSANLTKKVAKVGIEKVQRAAKSKAPGGKRAADIADLVRKGVKVGDEKVEQVVKSVAPAAETPAVVADTMKKDAKAGVDKMKRGAKLKDAKTAKDDESVNLNKSTEDPKPEASKSRKRKAPASADTEILKTNILDQLSEHASAKKKQKKASTKSKSVADTVGELFATATEGASAVRASIGGLATSIMGGASEAAEEATGSKKLAKVSTGKAQRKGKNITKDMTESLGKMPPTEGPGNADSEDDYNDEPDDHTAALLAGFESDGNKGGPVPGSGFQQGQKIPPLPHSEKTTKELEDIKKGANDGPGVVYVGRIPHGFYEHEMREYFTQFGEISRLRLSRNRKSGASRHYAFVEFTSAGVAKIVADTMDNYLMFGHILKCKVVPMEQIHESLWKGANKRFKAVPWNKIEGRKLEMGIGREQWAGRIEGEKKRRAAKNEKTKGIGYEFEGGDLKGVDQVPIRDVTKKTENGEKVEEEKSLVTGGVEDDNRAVVVVSEEIKTKRVMKLKGKTDQATAASTKKTKRALDVGEEVIVPMTKKVKKGKNTAA